MPTTLDQLGVEVMELTRQPGLEIIERRARRRRTRRRAAAAAAAVLGAQLVAGLGWAMVPDRPATHGVGTPSPVSSDRTPPAGGPLSWAAEGSATDLYALLTGCGACDTQLVGSADGGRTWTVRQQQWFGEAGQPHVLGPRTLAVRQFSPKRPVPGARDLVSTDGGHTWADLRASSEAVAKVPPGGWLECGYQEDSSALVLEPQPCALRVVDPAGRRISPLTHSPGIRPAGVVRLPAAAGLWVVGVDQRGVPSVSVSRDAGSTWVTHAFESVSAPHSGVFATVQISTHDGGTVHAIVDVDRVRLGFRSTDGGRTWTATNDGRPLPGELDAFHPGLTLPDGTHVLQQQVNGAVRPVFGRGGAHTYEAYDAPGWPATTVRAVADGSYLARDGQAIYRSEDGRTWQRLIPHA